jgi:hypothetical protein
MAWFKSREGMRDLIHVIHYSISGSDWTKKRYPEDLILFMHPQSSGHRCSNMLSLPEPYDLRSRVEITTTKGGYNLLIVIVDHGMNGARTFFHLPPTELGDGLSMEPAQRGRILATSRLSLSAVHPQRPKFP